MVSTPSSCSAFTNNFLPVISISSSQKPRYFFFQKTISHLTGKCNDFIYPINPTDFKIKIHPVSVNAANNVVVTITLAVSTPSLFMLFAMI